MVSGLASRFKAMLLKRPRRHSISLPLASSTNHGGAEGEAVVVLPLPPTSQTVINQSSIGPKTVASDQVDRAEQGEQGNTTTTTTTTASTITAAKDDGREDDRHDNVQQRDDEDGLSTGEEKVGGEIAPAACYEEEDDDEDDDEKEEDEGDDDEQEEGEEDEDEDLDEQQQQQQQQRPLQPSLQDPWPLQQCQSQPERQKNRQNNYSTLEPPPQGLGLPNNSIDASPLPLPGNDPQEPPSPTPTPVVSNSNLCSIHEDEPPARRPQKHHQLPPPSPPPHQQQPEKPVRQRRRRTSPPSAAAHADARDRDHHHHGQPLSVAPSPAPTLVSPPPPPSSPPAPVHPPSSSAPPAPPRRQSLLSPQHARLIQSLLDTLLPAPPPTAASASASAAAAAAAASARRTEEPDIVFSQPFSSIFDASLSLTMATRKIWVKRPHASATLITINNDDLVDDVRDLILRKYANSLGRTFDSPDLTIRICPRDSHKDRILGPEEPIGNTIESYFPGGQTVGEALIIDIPRRTPKASPRAPHTNSANAIYYAEDGRPSEGGEGYFPPVDGAPSPHLQMAMPGSSTGSMAPAMTILGTGHVQAIPSPGSTRTRYRERQDRPRLGRTHTSSPNLHNGQPASMPPVPVNNHYRPRHAHSRTHSSSSEHMGHPVAVAPIPKSPGADPAPVRMGTPPPRLSSPRLSSSRLKKGKKNQQVQIAPPGTVNAAVPPISVLIVEDNPINLKLLEAFVKRLKVRWQTAMNGKEAVNKWRTGGFHLVLMDIQLPRMNGLEATREIRRLERVNNIGVFSSTPGSMPEQTPDEELTEQDRLENPSLFKSPVIIVALTASSLQSDRHEALAAGCNDFLTKPVNFVWLEQKVREWGCMQALIDFDGWRKWKDYSAKAEEMEAIRRAQAVKSKSKKKNASQ